MEQIRIDYCADDFGLTHSVCDGIIRCARDGVLNKVSIFSTGKCAHRAKELVGLGVTLALHLNFVEGKSAAFRAASPLTDEKGFFAHDFVGLFRLSFSPKRRELKEAIKQEFVLQYRAWRDLVGEDVPLVMDSHQHTHMIPLIFEALLEALEEQGLSPRYLRIPSEPLMPFLSCPSLYLTYGVSGLCKQWLLRLLWLRNRSRFRKKGIGTSLFCGILFSGHMDEKRVNQILPHYRRLAEKRGMAVECLFHPGGIEKDDPALTDGSVRFAHFYTDRGRSVELEALHHLKI